MNYRRAFVPGGTFFFTLVTYRRRPIFSTPQAIDDLRDAFRFTMQQMPFTIAASDRCERHFTGSHAFYMDAASG